MMKVKPEAPKIEFPCANYSLKIVGRKTADYQAWVVQCVQQLAPELDLKKVQVVDSRNGTFQSIRLAVTAQSADHLQQIHQTLMASGKVKLVL
jgi:putative lipoic acid-binding regulatory protein|tara:strand:+ start:180 stop:458 length:279 start_codon:yes stop_codon:yes gene_type:complete